MQLSQLFAILPLFCLPLSPIVHLQIEHLSQLVIDHLVGEAGVRDRQVHTVTTCQQPGIEPKSAGCFFFVNELPIWAAMICTMRGGGGVGGAKARTRANSSSSVLRSSSSLRFCSERMSQNPPPPQHTKLNFKTFTVSQDFWCTVF